jgi:hypothetical protein
MDEWHGASWDNKSKGRFYLSEVLLGLKKVEHTLKNVIKAMGDESQSITHMVHCGSIILSLKHFHMS